MSIKINATSPIKEIVYRKLFGIDTVPPTEQGKMIERCARAVENHHNEEMEKLEQIIITFFDAFPPNNKLTPTQGCEVLKLKKKLWESKHHV